MCHSASATHLVVFIELGNKFSATDGLIRLSIDLEHLDDLIAVLDNEFRKNLQKDIRTYPFKFMFKRVTFCKLRVCILHSFWLHASLAKQT